LTPENERIVSRRYTLVEVDNIAGDNPSASLGTLLPPVTSPITFTEVRPGVFGTSRFFRVAIIDNFGCTAMSDVIEVVAPEAVGISTDLVESITCYVFEPAVPPLASRPALPGTAVLSAYAPITPGAETARWEITGSGGTPPYTIVRSDDPFLGSVAPVFNTLGEIATTTNSAFYELTPGTHYFRVTDINDCSISQSIDVGPAPAPIDFELEVPTVTLCPDVLGFVDLANPVTGGTAGPVYELWAVDGTSEVQIMDGTPIASVDHELGSSRFTGLPDLRTVTLPGLNASSSIYEYRVSSGIAPAMCPEVSRQFPVNQFPVLEFDAEGTKVSCIGEEDGSITVNLTSGSILGEYTALLVREEGIERGDVGFADGPDMIVAPGTPPATSPIQGTINLAKGTALPINVVDTTITNSVTFDNLIEGDYVLIISSPSGCVPVENFITIGEQQPFEIVPGSEIVNAPDCEEIDPNTGEVISGTVSYTLRGGTPPYYYVVTNVTAGEEQPSIETIFGKGAKRFDDLAPVVISGPEQGVAFMNNTTYRIYFVDSGNGMIEALPSVVDVSAQTGFNSCEVSGAPFSFDTPDLSGFIPEATFKCPKPATETEPAMPGSYEIRVNAPITSTLLREDLQFVVFNRTTGITTTGNRGENVVRGISPGEVEVSVEYFKPNTSIICTSLNSEMLTLEEFSELRIVRQVELDVDGNAIVGIDGNGTGLPYELVGLNKYRISAQGGSSPYTFEVNNTSSEGSLPLPLEIDLRGRATFEITESGIYSFSVTDSNGCNAFSSLEDIGFIDIEIPNVFNPSSSNNEVNRWYPDNLFFGSDIFPIPEEGIVVEEGITVITVTTGGITTGGTVSIDPNTGETIITGGNTTGGTIIVTTLNPDGVTTTKVTVTTGGTTVGNPMTVTRGGIVSVDPVTGETIITGGTTTGGTPSGGNPSGPFDTRETYTPGTTQTTGITVGNPTTDSSGTRGGTFVETTTRPGPNGSTITSVRVIDIGTSTSGVVNGGRPEGNIVIGGTVTGGNIITNSVPVNTVTSGGETINAGDDFVDFRKIEVLVFDRYGRLLEKFVGIKDRTADEGWDGTYQGEPMPTGDYWYLIKLNDRRGREITGHFTLYRSK